MRNIDKIIDEMPDTALNEQNGMDFIKRLSTLIAHRPNKQGRADLIERCARKFKVDEDILRKQVELAEGELNHSLQTS